MSNGKIRTRGRLPHWEEDHGVYFVTFRLADSLPKSALVSLQLDLERDPEIRTEKPVKSSVF